jgi:calcineurin-like phosphoesterase family protein
MSMGRALGNAHGHIHEKPSPPGPYLNVSVESINYTPISLEEARKRLTEKCVNSSAS